MFWFKRNEHKKGIYQKQTNSAKYFLDTGYYKAIEPYSFRDRKEGVGVYKKVDNSSYLWLPRIGERVNKVVEPTNNRNYNDNYGNNFIFSSTSSIPEAIEVSDFTFAYIYNSSNVAQYLPSDDKPFDNMLLVKKNNFYQGYDGNFNVVSYFPSQTGYTRFRHWKFLKSGGSVSFIEVWKDNTQFQMSTGGRLRIYAWFYLIADIYEDYYSDFDLTNLINSVYIGEREVFYILVESIGWYYFYPAIYIPEYDMWYGGFTDSVVDTVSFYDLDDITKQILNYDNNYFEGTINNDLWNFPYGSLNGNPFSPYFIRSRIEIHFPWEAPENWLLDSRITIKTNNYEIIPLNVSVPSVVKIGNNFVRLYPDINYPQDSKRVIFYYKGKIWAQFTYNGKKYVCYLRDFNIPTTSLPKI